MNTTARLRTALPREDCQRRLSASLVKWYPELPFFNWGPRKMIGAIDGDRFTIRSKHSGKMGAVVFQGTLAKAGPETVLEGTFSDTATGSFFAYRGRFLPEMAIRWLFDVPTVRRERRQVIRFLKRTLEAQLVGDA